MKKEFDVYEVNVKFLVRKDYCLKDGVSDLTADIVMDRLQSGFEIPFDEFDVVIR